MSEPQESPEAAADRLLEQWSDDVHLLAFSIAEVLWAVEGERLDETFEPRPSLPRGAGPDELEEFDRMLYDGEDLDTLRQAFPVLMERW